MKRRDKSTEDIQAAVAKAFREAEMERDAEHDAAVQRLLKRMDDFIGGGKDGSAYPAP